MSYSHHRSHLQKFSMKPITLETPRLILRPWQEEDLEPFAKLNADSRVMEYFPSLLTKQESDQMVKKIGEHFAQHGWGIWAVSVKNGASFIGFIGLAPVRFIADFNPAIEIGWRLAHEFWGKGYATEGAKACLQFAFETLHLLEVVSFTAVQNIRSQNVMRRLGMNHQPKDDFNHPLLPEGHPLRKHVLFRLNASEYFSVKMS